MPPRGLPPRRDVFERWASGNSRPPPTPDGQEVGTTSSLEIAVAALATDQQGRGCPKALLPLLRLLGQLAKSGDEGPGLAVMAVGAPTGPVHLDGLQALFKTAGDLADPVHRRGHAGSERTN